LTAPAYWTDADDAELDALVHEFIVGLWQHRETCRACESGGGLWCDRTRAALGAVLDWRQGRILRSKAEWLRIRELARSQLADARLTEPQGRRQGSLTALHSAVAAELARNPRASANAVARSVGGRRQDVLCAVREQRGSPTRFPAPGNHRDETGLQ
jgi:hypothetical protein